MKKKYIIYLLIILFSSINSFSQNLVSKIIDKKSCRNSLEYRIKNIGKQELFTNDTREDLELFSAINPTDSNNIIISWMSIDASSSATNPLLFKMKYTTNGGEVWENSFPDFNPHNLASNRVIAGGGDPVIAYDFNGRAYITWIYLVANVISISEIYLDNVMYWAYSDDKGANWTRMPNDTISWGVFNYELKGITAVDSGYPPDKQWMTVNPTNNDLYVSLTEFYHADSITNIWGVRRKQHESNIFEEKILVPYSDQFAPTQGSLVCDKTGKIHVVYPAYKDTVNDISKGVEYLYYRSSEDGGQTWSDTVVISKIFVKNFGASLQINQTNTKAYNRLYPCSYIAIDTSGGEFDGRVYVVWNSNDTNYFSNVNVYLSYTDDGLTWSEPTMINTDGAGDYKFHHRPNIAVAPNGNVLLTWYDTRFGAIPDVYNTDYFIGLSKDGGQTFVQRKVNDLFFNYNDINHAFYVGEYFQPIITNKYIYTFWSSFGSEGSDLELYYSKILIDSSHIQIDEYKPLNNADLVKIYPNPVSDNLNFSIDALENSNLEINICTTDGKFLISQTHYINKGVNNFNINVSSLEAGTYSLFCVINKRHYINKFIKIK
jgi:hypothetical protein